MGAGCVIVLWAIVAGILATIWLFCFAAFVAARWKKWKVASWIAAVPVILLPVLVAVFAGLVVFGVMRSSIPRYVYADTFNEAPTPDVRNIQSDTWAFADSAHVFLRFEANRETFDRIVPEDMTKVSFREYQSRNYADNLQRPGWWSDPTADTDEIFIGNPGWGSGRQFAGETALLTYDKETGTVMYFFLGID